MFCVLPLLVLSGVSIETEANFLLFLNVAMKLGEKVFSAVKTEFLFHFLQTVKLLFFKMREKSSKYKHSIVNICTVLEDNNLSNPDCTFISPIYTFPWRET